MVWINLTVRLLSLTPNMIVYVIYIYSLGIQRKHDMQDIIEIVIDGHKHEQMGINYMPIQRPAINIHSYEADELAILLILDNNLR